MGRRIVQQRLKADHRRRRGRFKAAVVTGLLAAASLALGGPLAPVGTAASFSVTTTADGGSGSLRRAIKAANANAGLDTISFAIPGSGVQTIKLTTGPLPVISSPLVIDGRTQSGYSGTPLVRLDNGTGNSIVGLAITAGASQVLGLRITRFFYGVSLDHAGGNTVAADWIGLDTASTSAGNTDAVAIGGGSSGNTIGGTTAAARNVISGNTDAGVVIEGYGTAANSVTGNYIGTNASGTAALANGTGVLIESGTQNNTVGGSGVGAGNVIWGNILGGVWIVNPDADGNTVAGNYIGTDPAGNHALANGRGVLVDEGASNNVVGGTTPGAQNVI